jgi:hypothetical protein
VMVKQVNLIVVCKQQEQEEEEEGRGVEPF